jgi:hypothetical protein
MKGTSPSQASRTPVGLRFTATKCQDGEANLFINSLVLLEGEIMAIVTVGIDLAKNVFAVHGVDEAGKAALLRTDVLRFKWLRVARPACWMDRRLWHKRHRCFYLRKRYFYNDLGL